MNDQLVEQELADEGIQSGIEKEHDSLETHEPFDPASISLSSKVVALDTVLRRIKNSTIKLAPDFQRKYVWDSERKSLLIESMMLRIPLPMFYVSEDREGVWEVVDGLQRLTTIRDFVLGPDGDGKGFKLKGLEFWDELFNGKDFYTIENNMKMARIINNIMEAELSFTIINPDTPEKVKRNIFKRINTGGMRLSMQEIRHALYQGEATKLLIKAVESNVYKRIIGNTIKDDRMAGRELALRYVSFYMVGRTKFKGDMDTFLSDTMRYINGDISLDVNFEYDRRRLIADFEKALERNYILFGEHAFRRSREGLKKTPVNKALFELWMYLMARAEESMFNKLLTKKGDFLKSYRDLIDLDDDFNDSIGRRSGDVLGVRNRYSKAIKLMREYIK